MKIISDTNIFLAVALDEPEKEKKSKSPFDIQGLKTKATTQDILNAIEHSRMG